MNPIGNHTKIVKDTALAFGFDYCGIAKAVYLEDDARRLSQWLNNEMHGTMHYMENNFDLRVDPTKLVPGAKSVITLLLNYFPQEQQDKDAPKVASYAFGEDYHTVIRNKLNGFFAALKNGIGEINGRGFVDSAPVLERAWAVKSGLGWIGKNGNLLNKNAGSYFFIASLIVDIELNYDDPFVKDYCGTCTRCIDACPTDAILPNKVVDGSRCISYYTIELKEALLSDAHKLNFDNWLFGCDVCQQVCPWNSFATPHNTPAFEPIPAILHYTNADWEALTEETFKVIFKSSPLKRSKFSGIKRNLTFIKKD